MKRFCQMISDYNPYRSITSEAVWSKLWRQSSSSYVCFVIAFFFFFPPTDALFLGQLKITKNLSCVCSMLINFQIRTVLLWSFSINVWKWNHLHNLDNSRVTNWTRGLSAKWVPADWASCVPEVTQKLFRNTFECVRFISVAPPVDDGHLASAYPSFVVNYLYWR